MESDLYPKAMLIATRRNNRLFRNNVGTFQTLDGRYIRTGLCPGSSDLIGWRSVTITQDMVGQTIAQFVALEAKSGKGRASPEQKQFISTVDRAGGLAAIVRTEQDVSLCLASSPVTTLKKY